MGMNLSQPETLPEARRYTQEFLAAQRPLFEADIRKNWPNRSLVRYGNGYHKANTNFQWLGWLACATAVARNLRQEVR